MVTAWTTRASPSPRSSSPRGAAATPTLPAQYLTPDAVLYDIVGGEHKGWPAIRKFFATGIEKWPDLALVPDQYWVNDTGVALSWVMTATVQDETFGPEAKGNQWCSSGMTWLVFDGGKVIREVDYHDSGAVARSSSDVRPTATRVQGTVKW